MSGRSNPDEASGDIQKDNIKDTSESKKNIYDRIREFSTLDGATLLQVDSTVIVGVLFFLTLTSFFDTEEGEGRLIAVTLTISAVGPFSLSAMLVLWANRPMHTEIWSHFIKKKSKEKDYKRMANFSRLAVVATELGFGYLLFVLGTIYFTAAAYDDRDIQNATYYCGKDPERYGINKTDVWQCSMFSESDNAKRCLRNSTQFDRSLSECHEFIPPTNEGA